MNKYRKREHLDDYPVALSEKTLTDDIQTLLLNLICTMFFISFFELDIKFGFVYYI